MRTINVFRKNKIAQCKHAQCGSTWIGGHERGDEGYWMEDSLPLCSKIKDKDGNPHHNGSSFFVCAKPLMCSFYEPESEVH
jgi:hypothetical protein